MDRYFKHEPNRIRLIDDELVLAEILFPAVDDETVDITRTFVDDSLRGQGIAGKLMEEAIAQLAKENKKIIPTCTYAAGWFEKHPEYKGLLK
ncbi:MAG: N-acetyltransferase [Lachnospiraceae bacterium]|jgi:predicted GNAT family acetyltransferase|nr:N-acetyltransferase [Lachnospiraceae bacterium]